MQYNMYVSNKTKDVERLYVRLRGDKLQESENYTRIQNEMSTNVSLEKEESVSIGGKKGVSVSDKNKAGFGYSSKHEDERKSRRAFACLVQGNFSLVQLEKPTPFAVEDINKLSYLSVHDEEKLWLTDHPVSPGNHGCITIIGNKTDGITAHPSNPKPVWIECERGDPLPDEAIHGHLYFGRVASSHGMPAKVTVSKDGKFCHSWLYLGPWYGFLFGIETSAKKGDILKDTGYELVRARRGDQMPANAIMTGVTPSSSLFVGRAGGNVPCKVSVKDGKIWAFYYGDDLGESSQDSGEILILTNDHAY